MASVSDTVVQSQRKKLSLQQYYEHKRAYEASIVYEENILQMMSTWEDILESPPPIEKHEWATIINDNKSNESSFFQHFKPVIENWRLYWLKRKQREALSPQCKRSTSDTRDGYISTPIQQGKVITPSSSHTPHQNQDTRMAATTGKDDQTTALYKRRQGRGAKQRQRQRKRRALRDAALPYL